MPREPIDITKLKPSELLRLAVQDAQKCEAMPDVYELDMNTWHRPHETCAVCMAGAIIAQTMGTDPSAHARPEDFVPEIRRALRRVDTMRGGVLLDEHGNRLPGTERLFDLIDGAWDYELCRAPWSVYLEAADMLEEAGL